MANRKTVSAALGVLSQFFPKMSVTEQMVTAWEMGLTTVPDSDVELGLKRLVQSLTTTDKPQQQPMPGDIKRFAQMGGTDWGQAWDEIMQKASLVIYPERDRNTGEAKPVEWTDPKIPQIMEQFGGAQFFWALPHKETNTARAQFRQQWEQQQEREQLKQLPQSPRQAALGKVAQKIGESRLLA